MKNSLAKTILEVIIPTVHFIRSEVKAAAPKDVSFPHFRVLANIHRGLVTVGQIADHHGVSQPAMTKMVNYLEQKGMVTKTQCERDRRKMILALTAKGLKVFEGTLGEVEARIEKQYSKLDRKQQAKLIESLLQMKSCL
jgi:DNA-binding MarR family transcriptional regulator